MKTRGKKNHKFLAYMAEKAFKEAVAEAIDEHRRNGVPIAIWRKVSCRATRLPSPLAGRASDPSSSRPIRTTETMAVTFTH